MSTRDGTLARRASLAWRSIPGTGSAASGSRPRARSPTCPRSASSRWPRFRGRAGRGGRGGTAAARGLPRLGRDCAADRADLLHAIADGIERRAGDLAQVETADNGALLRSHRRGVMPRAARNFRFFADWLGELGAR